MYIYIYIYIYIHIERERERERDVCLIYIYKTVYNIGPQQAAPASEDGRPSRYSANSMARLKGGSNLLFYGQVPLFSDPPLGDGDFCSAPAKRVKWLQSSVDLKLS